MINKSFLTELSVLKDEKCISRKRLYDCHTDFMYGKENNMKTNNVMLAAVETNVILHTGQWGEHPSVKI